MASLGSNRCLHKVIDNDCPELKFFMNESESDFTFIIDGQRLPALKAMLRIKSPVFDAMFGSDFKESKDKELEIKDINYQSFESMLRFVYCEQLVVNNEGNPMQSLIDIFKVGHKYQIKKLMNCCEEEMIELISIENIESFSKFAFNYNLEKLIKQLESFITKNYNQYKDKDMDWLKTFNANTNNILFELMFKKFRSIESHFRSKGFTTKDSEYVIINNFRYEKNVNSSGNWKQNFDFNNLD